VALARDRVVIRKDENPSLHKELSMKRFEYKIVDSIEVEYEGIFKGRKKEDIEEYLNYLALMVRDSECRFSRA